MSVVRDSEVLFRFVTPDGEGTARNVSEWHNTLYRRSFEKVK
jgi:hypothetical protein